MLWEKRTRKVIQVLFAVVGVLIIASMVVAYTPGLFL